MCNDVMMSLIPSHSEKVFNGVKTVEIRRRRPTVSPGTRIWVYETLPKGQVAGFIVVASVHIGSCRELWNRFGHGMAITRKYLEVYLGGASYGCAIVFSVVRRINPSVTLAEMRQRIKGFQPPQFFRHIGPESEELAILLQQRYQERFNPDPREPA